MAERFSRKICCIYGWGAFVAVKQRIDDILHNKNFKIAVETNGTIIPPKNIDWICVSPKKGAEFNLDYGNELKLVYPQEGLNPELFKNYDFDHFFLQPMDGKNLQRNILQSVYYCIENPLWRLSLQTHKIMGID